MSALPHPLMMSLIENRDAIDARCDALSDELQRLIRLLDALDGDPDLEPDVDGEPSLARCGSWADPCDDREIDEVAA